jgi:hypothetical protein
MPGNAGSLEDATDIVDLSVPTYFTSRIGHWQKIPN